MLDTFIRLLTIMSLVPTVQAAGGAIPISYEHMFAPVPIERPAGPVRIETHRVNVVTSSKNIFVADVSSGEVLYASGAHDVLPIASLTKLVTAMVVLDHSREQLGNSIQILQGDLKDDVRSAFLSGEIMSRRQLLEALLIGSVNSAGNALARETMGRDAFIAAMNQKVRDLGLATPTFVDPTGISLENRASAADVAAILSTALSYPEIREITQKNLVDLDGQSGKTYRFLSTNLLLNSYLAVGPYRIIGAKTGSLPGAGYSMAQVTRNPQGHEIVAVILGSEGHFTRYEDIKLVTAWVFDVFRWE